MTENDIVMKSVSTDDAQFLFALMNIPSVLDALNEVETDKKTWIEAIDYWCSDEDEDDYIIWKNGKRIAWFGVNNLVSKDNTVYLKMAVILPEYQSQGIGGYVIKELMNMYKNKGYQIIRLLTDLHNHKAQACYKKCGFSVIRTFSETMSNGIVTDRIEMERTLL